MQAFFKAVKSGFLKSSIGVGTVTKNTSEFAISEILFVKLEK